MFCKNCGNQIADEALFCPSCGTQQRESQQTASSVPPANRSYQTPPQQPQYTPAKPCAAPDDAPSGAFGFLCFLFPIVGLILFLVWHNEYPKKAKSCGTGAIVGVCVYVAVYILNFAVRCGAVMTAVSFPAIL